MLRKFIIREPACTDPNLDTSRLHDYNRLDLICRAISDALFVSTHLRGNVKFYAVLDGPPNPPVTIVFETNSIKNISESEKAVAETIKDALKIAKRMKTGDAAEVAAGISVQKRGFEPILKEESELCDVYLLEKKGEDIRNAAISPEKDALFIIGGHEKMSKKQESFIGRFSPKKVSVGPVMVFSSHTIVILHNQLDRLGIE